MSQLQRIAGILLAVLFIGVPIAEAAEALEWVGIDIPMTLRVILVIIGASLFVISARG